jgi:hypothetical protein
MPATATSTNRAHGDADERTYQGRTIRVKFEFDEFAGAPWDEFDPLGAVADWTTRPKAPGELILATHRSAHRFYDFAGAVAGLRRDGLTGPEAEGVARSEYEIFRSWLADDWSYMTATVTVDGLDYSDSLGGISGLGAADVIADLMPGAKAAIDKHQRDAVALFRLLTL